MKHVFLKILSTIVILWMASIMQAQDIIVTTDAKKIEAKITEVSKYEVKYKELDNLDGPLFTLETSDISSIIYANGKVVLYNQDKPEDVQSKASQKEEEAGEELKQEPQTAIVTTSNVSTANDYNAEILLLSGQIIRAKLMETANNYVGYTYNAKYFTMPASQVEKVTDLRNGKVTVYNGKRLDSGNSSNASTSSTQKGTNARIYRDNGQYIYNDTYISSKEVARILERENTAAYNQWKKADRMLTGGAVCIGLGGGLAIGGIFPLIYGQYNACIGLECAALVPLGIGLGLTLGASAKYTNAIDIYNSRYNHAAVQLKWRVSANGLGLAIIF